MLTDACFQVLHVTVMLTEASIIEENQGGAWAHAQGSNHPGEVSQFMCHTVSLHHNAAIIKFREA